MYIYNIMKNYGFEHQDLETVIIRGKNANSQKNKVAKKPHYNISKEKKKLEENNDSFKLKTINSKVSKEIVRSRTAKNPPWSQKDLAKRSQIPIKTIQEYENRKGKPNHTTLLKLEKCLGTKLTGKDYR